MVHRRLQAILALMVWLSISGTGDAAVADPQIRTDHPWYPGELACSTFDRLFETQAILYEQVTGRKPVTDQDRALAAWMWRNVHFAHGEEGKEDLWGHGFQSGDNTTREYWTGLFAHGFGLCGTTHAQWTAELNALLGPGRSRTVGVTGHNACEVYLQGDAYQTGRWALLDHDVSTVVFDPQSIRLLSIDEISKDLKRLTDPNFQPRRQQGWPLGGLHHDDPQAYAKFGVVEHLPGYAGPPPMVHLRRGESLRRYFQPGLEDGKTFVFWGRNYRAGGIPGPERSRTWVNQPENFFRPAGTELPQAGFRLGQARFGNAVFTYRPNFRDQTYREGVITESPTEVTFEFQSPYIIATTPANEADWGIYEPGGRNGLTIRSQIPVKISVSVDRGQTWHSGGAAARDFDLTDRVKGHRQYWLKLHASADSLRESALEMVTICQANPATFPRLRDNGSRATFAASGHAIVSAGPTRPQAEAHRVAGEFDSPRVTLAIEAPRQSQPTELYAAAHVASSNPPDPEIRYQIEYSKDGGRSWNPLVSDWRIQRQGVEPPDFWSQSFCYGSTKLSAEASGPLQVRFHNDGGKRYLRAEIHLAYAVPQLDPCRVTFHWSDDTAPRRTETRTLSETKESWVVPTGGNVQMHWVEMSAAP